MAWRKRQTWVAADAVLSGPDGNIRGQVQATYDPETGDVSMSKWRPAGYRNWGDLNLDSGWSIDVDLSGVIDPRSELA